MRWLHLFLYSLVIFNLAFKPFNAAVCRRRFLQLEMFVLNERSLVKDKAADSLVETIMPAIGPKPQANRPEFITGVHLPRDFKEKMQSMPAQTIRTEGGYVSFKYQRPAPYKWFLNFFSAETNTTEKFELKANLQLALQNYHSLDYSRNNPNVTDLSRIGYVKKPIISFKSPFAFIPDFQTSSQFHHVEIFDLVQNQTFEISMRTERYTKLNFGEIISSPEGTYYIGYNSGPNGELISVFFYKFGADTVQKIPLDEKYRSFQFYSVALNEQNIPEVYLSDPKTSDESGVKVLLK
jgi:hypothetical protein